jgi:hypothetical protein
MNYKLYVPNDIFELIYPLMVYYNKNTIGLRDHLQKLLKANINRIYISILQTAESVHEISIFSDLNLSVNRYLIPFDQILPQHPKLLSKYINPKKLNRMKVSYKYIEPHLHISPTFNIITVIDYNNIRYLML